MVFFFSSRRRHTRSTRDWSSDVCSSDLSPPWSYYAKAGYQAQWFEPGPTSLSIDYGQTRDRSVNGDVATRYGVQAAQLLRNYGKIGRASCRERGKSRGDVGCVKGKKAVE